jgi:hypothetical protein
MRREYSFGASALDQRTANSNEWITALLKPHERRRIAFPAGFNRAYLSTGAAKAQGFNHWSFGLRWGQI